MRTTNKKLCTYIQTSCYIKYNDTNKQDYVNANLPHNTTSHYTIMITNNYKTQHHNINITRKP